jgi:hypothetical protein
MRGWVEPISNEPIPTGDPTTLEFTSSEVVYRLTESGWSVIRGTHALLVATFLVSFAALLAALISLALAIANLYTPHP